MVSCVQSYGINGIQGYPVTVEVDISNGLPAFEIVGLPDASVKESKERVRSAIKNSGLEFPMARVTVNLAPADTRKEGPIYDLPIAVGLLMATGQLPENTAVILGELALNGDIRPVNGVLPMVIDARGKGLHDIILPELNAAEASYVEGMRIIPAKNLKQLAAHLSGEERILPERTRTWEESCASRVFSGDFAQIKGQRHAKRALEIAAAGGHNIIFIGPPGSGKTMLARSVPSILPELTFEEALEITKIHSVAGHTRDAAVGIVTVRPFRAPHHSISNAALTGGGKNAHPGEISLAHYGVLFLDELPEFRRDALEALRQPLEDGVVTVSRVNATVSYPSRFMLIASMNPCPCGNFGAGDCKCTPMQIHRYLSRISSPLLDRIDIHIEMGPVSFTQIVSAEAEEGSDAVRQRVQLARERQLRRYGGKVFSNAQLDAKMINRHCVVDAAGKELLRQAFTNLQLSARAYGRILKVARTIADLAGVEQITDEHIAEAVQYRSLDRKYWG